MDCWAELEIDATEDLKSIKRAYAKKLKTIDRVHDIDAFQRLRSAYDSARYLADTGDATMAAEKNQSPGRMEFSEVDRVIPVESKEGVAAAENLIQHNVLEASTDNATLIDPRATWQQVEEYLVRVDELLGNETLKYDPANWQSLWQDEILSQLRTKEILYEELFDYVARVTPSIDQITSGDNYMPEFVLPRYDKIFSWSTDEIRLGEQFDEDDVDRILLLSSHPHMQSKLQSASRDTSNFGKVYIWTTVAIVAAMFIKHLFF